MALPSSGQISMTDFRTEMGQTSYNNYSVGGMAYSPWNGNGYWYTPVNIHTSNAGKYPVGPTSPISFSDWYGYDNSLYYSPSDTFRDMVINWGGVCYSSTLTKFDGGTSNTTYDITISGSAADFSGIDYVRVYYSQPWNSSGTNTGSYAPIHEAFVNQSAYNYTFTYTYNYDAARGSKIYIVATAGCY
jgi:hypothetical protein